MMRVITKWIGLAGVAAGVGLGVYWTATTPEPPPPVVDTQTPGEAALPSLGPTRPGGAYGTENCAEARFAHAAFENASTLHSLSWSPFGRRERGWETYAALIATEIGTRCGPTTPGFASALSRWQKARGLNPTGEVNEGTFMFMKGVWQGQRPFANRGGGCPNPPPESSLASGRPGEGYSGKHVQLAPGAFQAYRRMVRDAKREVPAIRGDPRWLTIFSAYRSPSYDAARCARDQNCNGVTRARCSPHRTGRAMDLYVGQAPGYGPDSTADPNRLVMSKSPAYRWLVANAHRYGLVPYAFEPWHWEWIGDPSQANQG
jgi:D-alanyl-D-alanine carboxypeptidase